MKKNLVITTTVIILVISFTLYYFYVYTQSNTIPEGKGFIPVEINFENDIRNVTLTPGSSVVVNTTLTSNLDKEITVTIKTTLAALNNPPWFNVALHPNPLILKCHGTNSTTLTIHLTEETPMGMQPDMLILGLESTQHSNVRFWNESIQIYVKPQST